MEVKFVKGWRSRIGLLVPSDDCTMEPTFYEHLPNGIIVNTARLKRCSLMSNLNTNIYMLEDAIRAAKLVAQCEPDFILLGSTLATSIQNKGIDQDIGKEIEKVTGIPSSTTPTAICSAFRALNIKNISLFTPHIEELTEAIKAFFEYNGFKVTRTASMGIRDSIDISTVKPEEIYRFIIGKYDLNSDVIFFSSTNLRSMDIVKAIEQDFGIPVVTSNQASLWFVLRYLGFNMNLGIGKLFEKELIQECYK